MRFAVRNNFFVAYFKYTSEKDRNSDCFCSIQSSMHLYSVQTNIYTENPETISRRVQYARRLLTTTMPFEQNDIDDGETQQPRCKQLYKCMENDIYEIVDIYKRQISRGFDFFADIHPTIDQSIAETQTALNKAVKKFRITHARLEEELKRMLILNDQLHESNNRLEVRTTIADLVKDPESIEYTKRRLFRNCDQCNHFKKILCSVLQQPSTKDGNFAKNENTFRLDKNTHTFNATKLDDTVLSDNIVLPDNANRTYNDDSSDNRNNESAILLIQYVCIERVYVVLSCLATKNNR
ncbi:hypothetical protein GJ496_010557 [Pomphorhynchus laevis]|nr:hypothetical protein GJ496_010557 [Pomphorhynchus laevis]